MLQKILHATGGSGYLAGVGAKKGRVVDPATDRQSPSLSPETKSNPANHDHSNQGSSSTFPPSQGTSSLPSPDSSNGSNHPASPHGDNQPAAGINVAPPEQIIHSRPDALPPEPPPTLTTLTSTYPLVCGDSVGGRYGHSATAIGGSVVIYGGARGALPSSQLSDELAILDVGTMQWRLESGSVRRVGDAPLKTYLHSAAALGTKLWVFGGLQGSRDKRAPTSALHSLDLQTGFWAKASGSDDTPSPRHGHAMTATSAAIYVFGGRGRGRLCDDLFRLDPDSGEFTQLHPPQSPPACCGHTLTWDRADHLICIGGTTAEWGSGQQADGKCDPGMCVWTYSLSSNEWNCPLAAGQGPSLRTHHSTVTLSKGRFLLFGGCSSAEPGAGQACYLNDAYELDLRVPCKPLWRRHVAFNAPPSQRSMHSCVLAGARVVLYGGYSPKHTGYEGVVVLDVKCAREVGSLVEEIRVMGTAGLLPVTAVAHANMSTAVPIQALRAHQSAPLVGTGSVAAAAAGDARASTVPASRSTPAPVGGAPNSNAQSPGTSGSDVAAAEAVTIPAPQIPETLPTQQYSQQLSIDPLQQDSQQQQWRQQAQQPSATKTAPQPVQQDSRSQVRLDVDSATIPQQLSDMLAARYSQDVYAEMAQRMEVVTAQLQRERNICQVLRCEANAAELLRGESHAMLTTLQMQAHSANVQLARDTAMLKTLRATVEEFRNSLAAKEQDLVQSKASAEDLARQLGLITSQFCRQQALILLRPSSDGRGASITSEQLPILKRSVPPASHTEAAADAATCAAEVAATDAASAHEGYSSCSGRSPSPPQPQPGNLSHSACAALMGESRAPECIPRGRHDSPTLTQQHQPGTSPDPGEAYLGNQRPHSSRYDPSQRQQRTGEDVAGNQPTTTITTSSLQQERDTLQLALSAAEQQHNALAAELAAAATKEASNAAVTAEAGCLAANAASDVAVEAAVNAATASLQQRNAQLSGEEGALASLGVEALRALEQQLSRAAACVREALVRRAVTDELLSCGLCMDASREVAFGCGHQVCTKCAAQLLEECPFCRVPISVRIRLYDS